MNRLQIFRTAPLFFLVCLAGCARTNYPYDDYRAGYMAPSPYVTVGRNADYDRYPYYDYRHYPRYGSWAHERLESDDTVVTTTTRVDR